MPTSPKILIFVSYYIPGYKAGGPLRTIANMVEHLGHDFEFWIVTSDRDQGDVDAYQNLLLNQWVTVGKAQVFYCSSQYQTISEFTKLINDTPHDILYLNSFFDPIFTLKPLLARFLDRLVDRSVILAPRGEFSLGALKLKTLKKMIYIYISRLLGWYKNITWHVSSEHESKDIQRILSIADKKIIIALDLPSKVNVKPCVFKLSNVETYGHRVQVLRLIFLSRISPMKNLDFALHILSKIDCNVIFHIYGPLEDESYWVKCQALIKALPQNVQVKYCGVVMPDDVGATFANYDLFLFPTRGENYGHVIAEALTVGTSILLSDQTPWRHLAMDGLGFDFSLDNIDGFVTVIESYALKDEIEKMKIRDHIQEKVVERLNDPDVLQANRQLFYKCLQE